MQNFHIPLPIPLLAKRSSTRSFPDADAKPLELDLGPLDVTTILDKDGHIFQIKREEEAFHKTDSMNLSSLPDELALHFMTYLPVSGLLRLSQTCKKWRRLVLDGSLYKTIDRNIFVDMQNLSLLAESSRSFLRSLNLSGYGLLSNATLSSFAVYCPFIESLDLSGCFRISSRSISQLFFACKKLKKVNVSGLRSVNDHVLEVLALSDVAPSIEYLALSCCRFATSVGLARMLQFCTNIRVLKMANTNIDDGTLEILGKRLSKLEALDVASCPFLSPRAIDQFCNVFNASLDSLYPGCSPTPTPPLCHLNLSMNTKIPSSTISLLAKTFGASLQTLILAGCKNVDDRVLKSLGHHSRALRRLDLEDCTLVSDVGLDYLASYFPKTTLEWLCLSYCDLITNNSVLSLLANCERLFRLQVDRCNRLTDEILNKLVSDGIGPLRELDIYDCRGLTQQTIRIAHNALAPIFEDNEEEGLILRCFYTRVHKNSTCSGNGKCNGNSSLLITSAEESNGARACIIS